MFIVVCTSCQDCNSQVVALFYEEPSDEQIAEVKNSIGGMHCIRTNKYDIDPCEISEEQRLSY